MKERRRKPDNRRGRLPREVLVTWKKLEFGKDVVIIEPDGSEIITSRKKADELKKRWQKDLQSKQGS